MPKLAKRYVSTGTGGFSDDDAQVIGESLTRIAKANGVDGIHSLDNKLVYSQVKAAVRAGKSHELARFYDWNDEAEADKHRLLKTAIMIRSILPVDLDGHVKLLPEFVYVGATAVHHKGRSIRSRVLQDDVLMNDPYYASALGHKIRQVKDKVAELSHLARARKASVAIVTLVNDLEAAMDAYEGKLKKKAG